METKIESGECRVENVLTIQYYDATTATVRRLDMGVDTWGLRFDDLGDVELTATGRVMSSWIQEHYVFGGVPHGDGND